MPERTNKAPSDACVCSYPCSRHGNCAACQEYHRKDNSLTACGKDGKSQGSVKK